MKSGRNISSIVILTVCAMTVCLQCEADDGGENLLQGALGDAGSSSTVSFFSKWTENYRDGNLIEGSNYDFARIVPFAQGQTETMTWGGKAIASVTFTPDMSAFNDGDPVALLYVGTDDDVYNKFSYNYKFTVSRAGLYRLTGNAYIAKQLGYKINNENVMRRGVMAVVIDNEIGNKTFEMKAQEESPKYVESFSVRNSDGKTVNSTFVDFRVGNNTDYAKPISADVWLSEGEQYLSFYPPFYSYSDVKNGSSDDFNNIFVVGNLALYMLEPGAEIKSVAETNNEGTEYYNLQGIRIDNPERGLYIKVQNGYVTKVVL